jgi:hypothetical protein
MRDALSRQVKRVTGKCFENSFDSAKPMFQRIALENAAITDAGLPHLKALTQLQELYLRGTRITDAGIQQFLKALPKVKVER